MACPVVPVKDLLSQAVLLFRETYGSEPAFCGCAPGRVNLIGEHTDYNDGFVLPMALPLVTLVVGSANGREECTVVTTCPGADEPLKTSFPRHGATPGSPAWANYVKGVLAHFPGTVPGFNCVIISSVPLGSGLSSSAALEVAVFSFVEALTNQAVDGRKKALACQRAEHQFANVPCGVMDQFVSTMGKKGHALLIDCRSLECRLVPLGEADFTFVVMDTGVRHRLAGGEYAKRRAQCERAATLLGKRSLRDATLLDLEGLSVSADDELVVRRARHVIGEIGRTTNAATLLADGDLVGFGQLMVQSHESLRDLYEVSCAELDALVALALQVPGVLGSRMTGGGFGGCTVTLVRSSAVADLIAHVSAGYAGTPAFYIGTPSDGAHSFLVSPPGDTLPARQAEQCSCIDELQISPRI